MGYDYDKLYAETPNALGAPTGEIVAAIAAPDQPGARVLDIGCGQGRDALFIARLGYAVTGVDISPHGVRQMEADARAEGLAITGIVADLVDYVPDGMFAIVVVDRTLHMLATADRLAVLARLLDHVAPGGRVLIADEASNIAGFRQVLADHGENWALEKAKRGYLFARRA